MCDIRGHVRVGDDHQLLSGCSTANHVWSKEINSVSEFRGQLNTWDVVGWCVCVRAHVMKSSACQGRMNAVILLAKWDPNVQNIASMEDYFHMMTAILLSNVQSSCVTYYYCRCVLYFSDRAQTIVVCDSQVSSSQFQQASAIGHVERLLSASRWYTYIYNDYPVDNTINKCVSSIDL